MRYDYYISLNSSDYTQVYPSNEIELRGYWEDNYFARESINEIKLTKNLNSSIYTSLESYSTDPTRYNTELFFRIDQDSSPWKYFVFGIRWCKFDKETAVVTFTPTAWDGYYRFWKEYKDRNIKGFSAQNVDLDIYDYDTSNNPYDSTLDAGTFDHWLAVRLWDLLEDRWNTYMSACDIKSNILNNDSSTILACDTTYGIPLDYVTGTENVLIKMAFKLYKYQSPDYTIEDIVELLEMLQIYPFFESDSVFRLEHIKYFYTMLVDNAVNLTLDADENTWEYIEKLLPKSERFELTEENDNTDADFTAQDIAYYHASVGFEGTQITHQFQILTDVNTFIADDTAYDDTDMLLAVRYQHIDELREDGNLLTDTDKNTFTYTELAAVPDTLYIYSNDIKLTDASANTQLDCVVYLENSGAANFTACIKDRSGGNTISDTQVLTNNDTTTFTLTSLGGSENDGVFCIYGDPAQNDTIEGYVVVQTHIDPSDWWPQRLATEQGVNSSDYQPNGPFAQSNIWNNWWQTGRPTNQATKYGDGYSLTVYFTDSDFVTRRELKPRHYAADINMYYGINDGTRIGKIQEYVRKLDSDFVTFTLIYREDE